MTNAVRREVKGQEGTRKINKDNRREKSRMCVITLSPSKMHMCGLDRNSLVSTPPKGFKQEGNCSYATTPGWPYVPSRK